MVAVRLPMMHLHNNNNPTGRVHCIYPRRNTLANRIGIVCVNVLFTGNMYMKTINLLCAANSFDFGGILRGSKIVGGAVAADSTFAERSTDRLRRV